MNISNVTFIVGAGAHKPYGFPTGKELSEEFKKINSKNPKHDKNIFDLSFEQIVAKMENNLFLRNKLSDPSKIKVIIKELITNYRRSRIVNVDDFLFHYTRRESTNNLIINSRKEDEFIVGMNLLMEMLNIYENKILKKLDNFDLEKDWIDFVINECFQKKYNNIFKKFPNIITFNYDNLLELLIKNTLTYGCGHDEDEANEVIKSLGIVHVYGSTQTVFTKTSSNKNPDFNLPQISGQRSKEHSRIKNILDNTSYLYFLGFGFAEENYNLLFNNSKPKVKGIQSTNIGLNKQEMNRLKIRYPFLSYVFDEQDSDSKDEYNQRNTYGVYVNENSYNCLELISTKAYFLDNIPISNFSYNSSLYKS